MKTSHVLILLVLNFLLFSCHKEGIQPKTETPEKDLVKKNEPYELDIPLYFPKMTYNALSNPLTEKGVELGRKLFYEKRLSRNNTISCGTCHIQEHAFTDKGNAVSIGIDNRSGKRNSPAIQNMAFQSSYMWDGVFKDLNLQPLAPIGNKLEMDSNMNDIIEKLKSDANYNTYFKDAFGKDKEINENLLIKALAQFMVTLVSADSKYDQYKKRQAKLSDEELKGMALFREKCAICHAGETFTDGGLRDIGLAYSPIYEDEGKYHLTQLEVQDKLSGLNIFVKYSMLYEKQVCDSFPNFGEEI